MPSSYREQPAPAGLAGVVACVWRNETTTARELRVLPDGCMDLIWMDGAVHVAGPDSRAFLTTMGPRQVVTGLRFRPGAAPGVLGVPAWALRDQRIRLEDLWPGTTVSQRIAEVPNRAVGLAAAAPRRRRPGYPAPATGRTPARRPCRPHQPDHIQSRVNAHGRRP